MLTRNNVIRRGGLLLLVLLCLLHLKRRADQLLQQLNAIGCSPRKLVEWIATDTTYEGEKKDLIPPFAHRLLVNYPRILSTEESGCVVDLRNKTGKTWRFMLLTGNPTSMRSCIHMENPDVPILKSELLQLVSAALILSWEGHDPTVSSVKRVLPKFKVRLVGIGGGVLYNLFSKLFGSKNVEAFESETTSTAVKYFNLPTTEANKINTLDYRTSLLTAGETDITICDIGRSPKSSNLMADRPFLEHIRRHSKTLVVGVAHHQQYPMLSIIPAWVSVFKNIAVINAGKEVRILIGAGYEREDLLIPNNISEYLTSVLEAVNCPQYPLDTDSVKVFSDK